MLLKDVLYSAIKNGEDVDAVIAQVKEEITAEEREAMVRNEAIGKLYEAYKVTCAALGVKEKGIKELEEFVMGVDGENPFRDWYITKIGRF